MSAQFQHEEFRQVRPGEYVVKQLWGGLNRIMITQEPKRYAFGQEAIIPTGTQLELTSSSGTLTIFWDPITQLRDNTPYKVVQLPKA